MRALSHFIVDFLKREDGPTSVEYAILLALIVIGIVGQVGSLATDAKGKFTSVANTLATSS